MPAKAIVDLIGAEIVKTTSKQAPSLLQAVTLAASLLVSHQALAQQSTAPSGGIPLNSNAQDYWTPDQIKSATPLVVVPRVNPPRAASSNEELYGMPIYGQ